jgi:uncharacterized protein involved in response to NO
VKHATFHRGFLWAALVAALGAGFPIGAHLTFVIGFGFSISAGYASFVQTHGHMQLVGWAGLLVMGISLHFIPRLAGVPIARPQWLSRLVWLMAAGLTMRTLGQAMVPYLLGHAAYTVVAWLLVFSGLLEWLAVVGYVAILYALRRGVTDVSQRPALLAVQPYFGMMVSGWLLYASLNLVLLVHMGLSSAVVLHGAWNFWAIQSFLGLVLLPVAFAFSLRLLPLYLRLPPINRSAPVVAYVYLIALTLYLLASLSPLLSRGAPGLVSLAQLGILLKVAVILWFVWRLDVLTRWRRPWTVNRQLHPGPERRPTRPGLPDYGEFGRFERLVYAAYIWLILAACTEAASALAVLTGSVPLITSPAALHMYLMGFISQLILAMAVRMLPGFLHKRRVARPGLVETTFWLVNASALGRVGLFLLPAEWLSLLPSLRLGARLAFALSGLLGLAAVLVLAINLWLTSRLEQA